MFHYFTIKFHFSFFAYFCFKFFPSLHFSDCRFEAKQSKVKFKSIFSLFFRFFNFFRFFSLFFALNFSLRLSNFCFEAKQSEAKQSEAKQSEATFKSIFSLFHIFSLFSLSSHFHLIFVSLRFFRLILASFTFVFASDFW